MNTLQERVDAIAYPPTHTYSVDTLEPTSWLAQRVAVLDRVAPDLFKGRNFLEVGCNKGYFALRAAKECHHVVGFDIIPEYVDLCRDLAPDNCEFHAASWSEFCERVGGKYDRIFIGNGPHYPYREVGGWRWVSDLAEISTGLVVVEGATGMDCPDMPPCIPSEMQAEFNKESMLAAYNKYFTLESITPSPLVGRYFMVFRRKDDLLEAPMLEYANYLEFVYRKMAAHTTHDDSVMEVCTRHDRGVISPVVIPFRKFLLVDRDPTRPGFTLDAITDELPECDVLLSTALLHHTPPKQLPALFRNLAKSVNRTLMFSGPSVEMMPDLIGDHEYHIDIPDIARLGTINGFDLLRVERVGLSHPYSEVLLVFEREA